MEFLPLIGIVLLFWLFIIRPQSRRQKELRSMQSSLTVGDEVMLTSGIFGTVQDVADDYVMVEVSTGVAIKVAQGAIGSKIARPTDDDNEPGTVTDGPEES